eukprot:4570766-Prorocentrum_lima.AAC.1
MGAGEPCRPSRRTSDDATNNHHAQTKSEVGSVAGQLRLGRRLQRLTELRNCAPRSTAGHP